MSQQSEREQWREDLEWSKLRTACLQYTIQKFQPYFANRAFLAQETPATSETTAIVQRLPTVSEIMDQLEAKKAEKNLTIMSNSELEDQVLATIGGMNNNGLELCQLAADNGILKNLSEEVAQNILGTDSYDWKDLVDAKQHAYTTQEVKTWDVLPCNNVKEGYDFEGVMVFRQYNEQSGQLDNLTWCYLSELYEADPKSSHLKLAEYQTSKHYLDLLKQMQTNLSIQKVPVDTLIPAGLQPLVEDTSDVDSKLSILQSLYTAMLGPGTINFINELRGKAGSFSIYKSIKISSDRSLSLRNALDHLHKCDATNAEDRSKIERLNTIAARINTFQDIKLNQPTTLTVPGKVGYLDKSEPYFSAFNEIPPLEKINKLQRVHQFAEVLAQTHLYPFSMEILEKYFPDVYKRYEEALIGIPNLTNIIDYTVKDAELYGLFLKADFDIDRELAKKLHRLADKNSDLLQSYPESTFFKDDDIQLLISLLVASKIGSNILDELETEYRKRIGEPEIKSIDGTQFTDLIKSDAIIAKQSVLMAILEDLKPVKSSEDSTELTHLALPSLKQLNKQILANQIGEKYTRFASYFSKSLKRAIDAHTITQNRRTTVLTDIASAENFFNSLGLNYELLNQIATLLKQNHEDHHLYNHERFTMLLNALVCLKEKGIRPSEEYVRQFLQNLLPWITDGVIGLMDQASGYETKELDSGIEFNFYKHGGSGSSGFGLPNKKDIYMNRI